MTALLLAAGCGNPGSPLPPSLMLPQPVTDLRAARTGEAVLLQWTMTQRTTDRVKLKSDQRAAVCRGAGPEPCVMVGELLLAPGAPASFTDTLPPELRQGSPRLLRYEVQLRNHAGRSAGASNAAWTAAGDAPPPVQSLTAENTQPGLLVRWQAPAGARATAPGARLLVRLQRSRVLAAGESGLPGKQESQAGVPQPLQQTLEAPEHAPEHPPALAGGAWSPDRTLDTQAARNRTYRYTAQLVEQLTLSGHFIELSGAPAQSSTVSAMDVFPPAVPADLAAVANADSGVIDLSWSADSDADLAGYFVYRRAADSQAPAERVSGNAPLPTPAWTDTKASKGQRCSYSVSAVDNSGNESARSAEVSEGLPAPR